MYCPSEVDYHRYNTRTQTLEGLDHYKGYQVGDAQARLVFVKIAISKLFFKRFRFFLYFELINDKVSSIYSIILFFVTYNKTDTGSWVYCDYIGQGTCTG